MPNAEKIIVAIMTKMIPERCVLCELRDFRDYCPKVIRRSHRVIDNNEIKVKFVVLQIAHTYVKKNSLIFQAFSLWPIIVDGYANYP